MVPGTASFRRSFLEMEQRFNALEPEAELTIRDPDHLVEGHVVVWCTQNAVNGPLGRCGKGGTRIRPDLNLDEVRMLARTQSLKNAAAGLPLGGAKSGLRGDPDAPDFEQTYRRFVQLTAPMLRSNGGLWGGFGFDIGARPNHCHWAIDELGQPDAFTGKPLELGGTNYDQEGIAGLGVAVAAATLLERTQHGLSGARVAIQGLGAMGAAVCRYASELGMQVVAVADPRVEGCWVSKTPVSGELLSAIATMQFETTARLLPEYGFSKQSLASILTQRVDVLFPCAVQNVIHADNVNTIRSWAVVEGANNPTTPEGQKLLHQKGIQVIPDIIANPGGAIAAFVELTSDVTNEENALHGTKCVEAKEMTRQRVADNVSDVLEFAESVVCSPSEAAHYRAYERIFDQSR